MCGGLIAIGFLERNDFDEMTLQNNIYARTKMMSIYIYITHIVMSSQQWNTIYVALYRAKWNPQE